MGVIKKVRATIDKGLDKLVDWVVTMAKKLGKFILGKATGAAPGAAAPPGDVRQQARTALTREFATDRDQVDAERVVTQVGSTLRPAGLKRLTIGPPDKDGKRTIEAEASPVLPLAEFLPRGVAPRGRSVRVMAELVLRGPSPVGAATLLPAGESATVPRGGAILRQDATRSNVLRAFTWNTSDIFQAGNTSHAEHQLAGFLAGQGDVLSQTEQITVSIWNYSPCATCAEELARLLARAGSARGRAFNQGSSEARIHWLTYYPGIDLRGTNATSWDRLHEMQSAGWRLYAPGTAMPPNKTPAASKVFIHLL